MKSISDWMIWAGAAVLGVGLGFGTLKAEPLPWQNQSDGQAVQPYRSAQSTSPYGEEPAPDPYRPGVQPRSNDAYSPGRTAPPTAYSAPSSNSTPYQDRTYQPDTQRYGSARPVEPYQPDYGGNAGRYQNDDRERYREPYRERAAPPDPAEQSYSRNEVIDAGHRFFGSLSSGLARAIEYAFKSQGRPNGYILGEDAGGAFIAGLRYGEGRLYTKHAGVHRVFWQGPSLGYDFGGDGARTMTLVYNLRSPRDIYKRFAGVQGSAYVVGGVSVQLLKGDDVTLAPIRTGVGLRLGANIGYLKYTRRPTWNPF